MNKKGKVSGVSPDPELGVSGFYCHVHTCLADYSLSHICIILATRSLLIIFFAYLQYIHVGACNSSSDNIYTFTVVLS